MQTAVAVAFNWIPVIEALARPTYRRSDHEFGQKTCCGRARCGTDLGVPSIRRGESAGCDLADQHQNLPVGYLAPLVGFSFASLLNSVFGFQDNELEVPPIDNPLQRVLGILTTGMAGPTEELGRVS